MTDRKDKVMFDFENYDVNVVIGDLNYIEQASPYVDMLKIEDEAELNAYISLLESNGRNYTIEFMRRKDDKKND